MAVDEMYLENIEEFVYDENKIVTYKGLSLNLGVHVNQAKQMLYSFVQHQRNKKDKDDLHVFYCVAGVTQDNSKKVCKVQLVPEEQLSAAKSSLSPLISCHVYSVQKQKLKDTNTLFTADYDLIREHILQSNQYSAITCRAAQPRSQDEIDQLREQTSSKGFEACTPRQNGTNHSKPSKPAGIAGMFAGAPKKDAKSAQKTKDASTENGDSSEGKKKSPEKENSKAKPKQGGVMSFFAKQATKPKVEKKEEPKTEVKEEMIIDDSDEEIKPKQTQKGKKKKVESDDEEEPAPQKKKRRRIQVSDSSSEEEEDMEEEPIPPSPPPAPREPSPPPKQKSPVKEEKQQSPKKAKKQQQSSDNGTEKKVVRKKKLVSKTYVNDEGFMVTEKVYEDEEVEVVEETKKPSPVKDTTKGKQQEKKKTPPKKNGPKAGAKQTNMMSFFKKK